MTLPSLFLSHGAPTLPLTDTPARTFLGELGGRLARPRAILVISAHWETAVPTISAVDRNETIHDFSGFPRPLYQLRYPAPGSPAVAADVAELLRASGFESTIDRSRGLAIGRALAPLRQQGVLIIGSGSMTHDLSEFRGHGPNDLAPEWVNDFADWFHGRLTTGQTAELLDYRRQAPFAAKNHSSEEHLLPLFAALGAAGGDARAERLHASSTFSVLRMDVYAFGAPDDSLPKQGIRPHDSVLQGN
jgi:4,5-DOPA dioxygenase extradiol